MPEVDMSVEVLPVQADQDPDTIDPAKKDEDILKKARARLELAEDAESDIRRLALEDIEFSTGKQWPDNIEQERNRDGRPCLVINRMPQFIQQVTNDQRQNRPAIKVHPVDSGAQEETAKIIQGIIRHIEYNSNAEVAYDTAFEFAARGGFGYWRIETGYASPMSFDQEIYIKKIKNSFCVLLDPNHIEPDGSDSDWGWIGDYYTRVDFKEKWPYAKASSSDGWDMIGNLAPRWHRDGSIAVGEYFFKEMVPTPIYLLSTGETVLETNLQARLAEAQAAGIQVDVVESRIAQVPKVKWVKMNGVEILERGEWAGKYIPIIPVYGNEININGKRILEGLVRHAKDPQRMYNYWASAETEAIALAPKAPFVLAAGQIEGFEHLWKTANRANHAYLPYNPTSIEKTPVPPPQRQSFEPAVQAITQARMLAADDMKATTGIYDPSLGNESPDTSGIAIQRRNIQAQTSNFHFMDNLTRSIRHNGRILIDLIPHIYDTARITRIIGEDGSQSLVRVNEPHKDEKGNDVLYDLDAGLYDCTVDVGPSYASKRQEAAASMQSLAQSYPPIMQIAGDLFVKNMDWPGAQEISERIKKTLPPGLADDPKSNKQIPPQVQVQMQQMSTMISQLSSELKQATDEIRTRKIEHESRERIEMAKIQADLEINAAKLGSKEDIELLKHQIAEIHHRFQTLGGDETPIPNSDGFAMEPAGVNNASGGPEAMPQSPTGGAPPGPSMEGNHP